MEQNYSIVIQWSKQNRCFIASLPEWEDYQVEGESYETVLANAKQTIALLVQSFAVRGKELPTPQRFELPSLG